MSLSRFKPLILLLLLLPAGLFLLAGDRQPLTPVDKSWQQIDSLRNSGRYVPAYRLTEQVRDEAMKRSDHRNIIRAWIYLTGLAPYGDASFNRILREMEATLPELPSAEKAIMQSLMAEMYTGYYQSNAHAINQRSDTGLETPPEDIDQWSKVDFKKQVFKLLETSLENLKLLQETSANDYKPLVKSGEESTLFDFSLYELLLQRKLNILSGNPFGDENNLRGHFLTDTALFSAPADFIHLENPLHDENDVWFRLFRLWQQSTETLLEAEKYFHLTLITINRFESAQNWFTGNEPEQRYLNSLKHLYENVKSDNEAAAWVFYRKAAFLSELGSRYDNEREVQWKNARQRALELINTGRMRYQLTMGANNMEILLEQINEKSLSVAHEAVWLSGKPQPVFFQYRNVDSLQVDIYRITAEQMHRLMRFQERNLQDSIIQTNDPVHQQKFTLLHENNFNTERTETLLPDLNKGMYLLNFWYMDERERVTHRSTATVSQLANYTVQDGRNLQMTITDRLSGKPMRNVRAVLFRNLHRNPLNEFRTGRSDRKGGINFKLTRDWAQYTCFKVDGNDTLITRFSHSGHTHSSAESRDVFYAIYTDRAIYRPGQTVHFKAIAYHPFRGFFRLNTNRNIEVRLLDANRQTIATKNLRTNDFGSTEGSFNIPTDILAGNWQINIERSTQRFRVEEYRRPGFEILFDETEKKWQLNDTVEITGEAKTFFGSPLSNGKVSYTVKRRSLWFPFFSRFRQPHGQETEIASGTSTLENGRFRIEFPALPDLSLSRLNERMFHFEVQVQITDESGETHSRSKTIPLSFKPFSIQTNLPENVHAENWQGFFIESKNLQGNPVRTSGEWTLSKLTPHPEPIRQRPWQEPTQKLLTKEDYAQKLSHWPSPYMEYSPVKGETILRQQVEINGKKTVDKSLFDRLDEGMYRLEITLTGEKGDTVSVEQDFVWFSGKNRQMPIPAFLWVYSPKDFFFKGDHPEILLGSSVNAKVRLQIATSNGLIKDEWINLNNRKRLISINTGRDYTGRVNGKVTMVYSNMVFEERISFFIAPPSKYLTAEWIQKMDTLAPGSTNQWELLLKDEAGKPVEAELMAVLYDASLDVLAPHHWRTPWSRRFPSVQIRFHDASSFHLETPRVTDFRRTRWTFRQPQMDELNHFGFRLTRFFSQYYIDGVRMRGSRSDAEDIWVHDPVTLEESAEVMIKDDGIRSEEIRPMASRTVIEDEMGTEDVTDKAEEPAAIREDFAETAFFYPILRSDENGKVDFSFDMPESLTRWRFMGMGHTEELRTVIIEETAITHQNWIVKSYLPRWVREGDSITFTATTYNLSNMQQTGQMQIQIRDALSQKDITTELLADQAIQSLTVDAGASAVAGWKIVVPGKYRFLEVNISGRAGEDSDGEKHLMPVLPLYVPVTESFNFYVDKAGEHIFDIPFAEKMRDRQNRPELFRLEYTPRPSWQVIFALPNLLDPVHFTADNLAAQYFAITLGHAIFEKHPEIPVTLKALQQSREDGDRNILDGFLKQHPEFKSLVLEATPWVRQAEAESTNIQSLLELNDKNHVHRKKQAVFRRLQNYQTEQGGFSWFPNGRPNAFTTRVVLELFGKLRQDGLPENDREIENMLNRARTYLLGELADSWNRFKQNDKYVEIQTPYFLLNHTYALSFYAAEINDNKLLLEIIEHAGKHQVKFNPMLQAMTGMTAQRFGEKAIAREAIEILKGQAIQSANRGTFWRTIPNSWRWQDAPVETHSAIMNAFLEIAPSENELLKGVQKWLLLNKQVNGWRTNRATSEAVWVMLKAYPDMLTLDATDKVQFGSLDWRFDGREAEPGSLYRSETFSGEAIRELPEQVKVTSGSDELSWGAAFFRYQTPISSIEDFWNEISVQKSFLLQRQVDGKTISKKVEEGEVLQQGDMLISRLVLHTDRPMEFLHLQDIRPPVAEPVETLSGRRFTGGLSYYMTTGDTGSNLFFDRFPAGTFIIEIPMYIVHKGVVAGGNTTFQSFYAPSFTAGSGGGRVRVE